MRSNTFDQSKRLFDICTSATLLAAASPALLAVAILVRLKLGSPVLFRQDRPGRDERVFKMLKFRTMLEVDPENGLVSDDDRMTRLGTLLRATSIDELPSLWNILKGDMSVVGPRPLLVAYIPLYTEQQRRRHQVRPGLTGLAQISGRNSLPWSQRLALDVEYVDNQSWRMDLSILLRTISKVVARDGISSEGHVAGEPFRGSVEDGKHL